MKNLLLTFVFLLLCSIVLADSPPALPMEVWGEAIADGSPVVDGLSVKAMVNGEDFAQASVTKDGYYDVLIVNGDRPLTYNNDPTCATHWGAGEACVPCTVCSGGNCVNGYNPATCIEGPQDGTNVNIVIDDKQTIPIVVWNKGGIVQQDLIVITGGVINFTITLTEGWNLISIPLLPIDSSISSLMTGCDYNRIWEFQSDQSWKSTDTGLVSMDLEHGYWVDRVGLVGDCDMTISGTIVSSTTINVYNPWSLVGYPSLTPQSISALISGGLYNRIWEFQADKSWKSTDTGLTHMQPGKGYWIDTSTTGSYEVTN
jgi:hypothetical protein